MNNVNRIPSAFIFQGRWENDDTWKGKLEPIKATLFYIGEKGSPYIEGKPVVVKSDNKGMLFPVNKDLVFEKIPYHFVGEKSASTHPKTFIKPPVAALSYLATSYLSGTFDSHEWAKRFHEQMNKVTDSHRFTANLKKIPLKALRAPDRYDDKDKDYREWIADAHAQRLQHVFGYVLPKVRAVYFVLTIERRYIKDIEVNIPDVVNEKKLIRTNEDGDISIYVLEGNESELPKGLYEITVALDKDALDEAPEQWSGQLTGSSSAYQHPQENPSYTLKAMARYDINNDLGDFSVIICDPISLEETMITQYPKAFGHLLEAAKKLKNEGKISASDVKSQGLFQYMTRWSAIKSAAELTCSTSMFDIDGSLGKTRFGADLVLRLADTISSKENSEFNKYIDSLSATKGAAEAWEAVFNALNPDPDDQPPTGKRLLEMKYLKMSDYSPGSKAMANFDKSLLKQLGKKADDNLAFVHLSEDRLLKAAKMMEAAGKGLAWADTITSTVAITKHAYSQAYKHIPDRDSAVTDFKTVMEDYALQTGQAGIRPVSVVCNIEFELREAIIKPEYQSQLDDLAMSMNELIAQHENLQPQPEKPPTFVITGHTCLLGDADDNIRLSMARAEAVRDYLAAQQVPTENMRCIGYGEIRPVTPESNQTDAGRKKNRRVVINHAIVDVIQAAPCREGINTLEKYRHSTVLKQLQVDDATYQLIMDAVTVAYGGLCIIPATAAAANTLLVIYQAIKATGQATVSILKAMDDAVWDNTFSSFLNDNKQRRELLKSSDANFQFMDDYKTLYDPCSKNSYSEEMMAQYRLRAEAISGLIYLMLMAAMDSDNDEAYVKASENRYKISAYIQNFILNDQWLYPTYVFGGRYRFNLGAYWANVTLPSRQKAMGGLAYLGLDADYLLLSKGENVKKEQLTRGRSYYLPMLQADDAVPEKHIKANFLKHFPIHNFATTNFNEFVRNFRVSDQDYKRRDYRFIGVFGEHDEAWISLKDRFYSIRQTVRGPRKHYHDEQYLTHESPVSIVVILDKAIQNFVVVSAQLVREDVTLDIDGKILGPTFSELARPLQEDDFDNHPELQSKPELWQGHYGCIITPFYQFGKKNIMGLKPMAPALSMSLIDWGEKAINYYNRGNLTGMQYQVNVSLAKVPHTRIIAPLWAEYPEALSKKHPLESTVRMTVDIEKPTNAPILNKEFLASVTEDYNLPTLFTGKLLAHSFIRLLPEVEAASPSESDLDAQEENATDFLTRWMRKDYIESVNPRLTSFPKAAGKGAITLTKTPSSLIVDNFNWGSGVEFMVALLTDKLNTKAYEDIGHPWKTMPCSANMMSAEFLGDEKGPQLTGNMYYIGKAKKEGLDYYLEFDKDLPANEKSLFSQFVDTTDNNRFIDYKFFRNHQDLPVGWEQSIYIAHFKCQYTSPKGVKVHGMRPFGERKRVKLGSLEGYFGKWEYYLANFNTIAGIKGLSLEHSKFEFSHPESYLTDVPWARTNPDINTAIYPEGELLTLLKDEGITEKRVKEWLEAESHKTEFDNIVLKAIKT